MKAQKKKGFTLIELLIVIGIIAVLMAIAIVAINPGRQFAKVNNARRWGDVSAIANAIAIRIIEAKGDWPAAVNCENLLLVSGGPNDLAYDDPGTATDDANVDLCGCLVPDYLGSMPTDPNSTDVVLFTACGSNYNTGYEISRDATSGRIKISAPTIDDEGPGTPGEISVSR